MNGRREWKEERGRRESAGMERAMLISIESNVIGFGEIRASQMNVKSLADVVVIVWLS